MHHVATYEGRASEVIRLALAKLEDVSLAITHKSRPGFERLRNALIDDELIRLHAAMKIRIFGPAGWNYFTRTLAGHPPTGDEWWPRRALHHDDRLLE